MVTPATPGGVFRRERRGDRASAPACARRVPHDRHADAVAADMVGVVVARRQPVIVGSPISRAASRGDSRRERTCRPSTTQDRLPRRAAGRRAQAARDVVEPHLGALALAAVRVGPGAPVDARRPRGRPRAAPPSTLARLTSRHQAEQIVASPASAAPFDAVRLRLDEVGEARVRGAGARRAPPEPARASPRGSGPRARDAAPAGCHASEGPSAISARERLALGDGDEEHARPRLRHEARRVDRPARRSDSRAPASAAAMAAKSAPAVRGQAAVDVFQHDRARRAALARAAPRISRQNGQNVPERVGALSRSPPSPR